MVANLGGEIRLHREVLQPQAAAAQCARGVYEVGHPPFAGASALFKKRLLLGFGRIAGVAPRAGHLSVHFHAHKAQVGIGAVGEQSRILADLQPHPLQIGSVLHVALRPQRRVVVGRLELGVALAGADVLVDQGGHVHLVVVGQDHLQFHRFDVGLPGNVEKVDQLVVSVGLQYLVG